MKELLAIQSALKAPKNQYNKFGGYKYRSCEDILEAVKPLLAEEKSVLTLSDDMIMLGNRFYIKATATIKNSTGGEVSTTSYARETEARKGMDDSQITGSTSSYARKYALNGLFLIDDTKDADATNNHEDMGKSETDEYIYNTGMLVPNNYWRASADKKKELIGDTKPKKVDGKWILFSKTPLRKSNPDVAGLSNKPIDETPIEDDLPF